MRACRVIASAERGVPSQPVRCTHEQIDLAGPGPASVAGSLRRSPRVGGACGRQSGLETFAALRYAVPLCRRIRVFHDQR
ncbi:hypothetical protein G6F58_013062 [Rhizopus delemar]|nr:hypothetical protein G6F58_013062 [Rhizopus delemar]